MTNVQTCFRRGCWTDQAGTSTETGEKSTERRRQQQQLSSTTVGGRSAAVQDAAVPVVQRVDPVARVEQ